jgi:N-formylglutamate deformylase
MTEDFFEVKEGPGPFIAAAIHEGHKLRDELHPYINLDEKERLREEDPFTGIWAEIAETTIKGKYSRFEVDLNRPRTKAVYKTPEDAWGLHVWKEQLPDELVDKSIEKYDNFYQNLKKIFDDKTEKYGGILVYDFHSYNHLRDGKDKRPADPKQNPEINLGTVNMNRKRWEPVIVALTTGIQSFNYFKKSLDVRENVKFKGGYFSQWIYENYPEKSCVIAIEVKKFFMDEWTGIPDYKQINLLKKVFESTVPDVLAAFQKSPG